MYKKKLKDDAAKREAKRKLQHQQEIDKAHQAVRARPAPVEYGAAELPNEEANAQGEPTPGPSGLSTVTDEPPLSHRAPTGNIIRLNAVESTIENDQRNESKDKTGEKEESTTNQGTKRALSTDEAPEEASKKPKIGPASKKRPDPASKTAGQESSRAASSKIPIS